MSWPLFTAKLAVEKNKKETNRAATNITADTVRRKQNK